MFPISMSSSTTKRRGFPIEPPLHAPRPVSGLMAHGFNLLRRHLSLERAKPAQAKAMLICNGCNFVHTLTSDVFAKRVIFKAAFQSQGYRFRHTGVGLARWKAKVKVEINGAWHINHTAV